MYINIFGSTGTIGTKSLKLINKYFPNLKIDSITANNNYKKFILQIYLYKPKAVYLNNPKYSKKLSKNIQILKNVKNVDNGYYLVLAVHTSLSKRNDFITKVIASGHSDVDFFYDVNTSKYYIYYDKFKSIKQANKALEQKGNKPYNQKLSLVKIEN